MPYKVEVIESECIGCGACTAVCDNFEINDKNVAVAKKKVVDDSEQQANQSAAESCPKACIKVTKAAGKK